jgi:hypothetical protein
MPKALLAKDAQIIVRVTVEGSSKKQANQELDCMMDEFQGILDEYIASPYNVGRINRRTLSYDIYVSGDPQLGYGSEAHRKGVVNG